MFDHRLEKLQWQAQKDAGQLDGDKPWYQWEWFLCNLRDWGHCGENTPVFSPDEVYRCVMTEHHPDHPNYKPPRKEHPHAEVLRFIADGGSLDMIERLTTSGKWQRIYNSHISDGWVHVLVDHRLSNSFFRIAPEAGA